MPAPALACRIAVVLGTVWTVTVNAQEQLTPKAEAPKSAPTKLVVYPGAVRLDGSRDEQRLGVLGEYAEGRSWDLSRDATFAVSDPKVAVVDRGVVRPVGDGQATITVVSGGQTKTVPVSVTKSGLEKPIEFTREIVPILTKAGTCERFGG